MAAYQDVNNETRACNVCYCAPDRLSREEFVSGLVQSAVLGGVSFLAVSSAGLEPVLVVMWPLWLAVILGYLSYVLHFMRPSPRVLSWVFMLVLMTQVLFIYEFARPCRDEWKKQLLVMESQGKILVRDNETTLPSTTTTMTPLPTSHGSTGTRNSDSTASRALEPPTDAAVSLGPAAPAPAHSAEFLYRSHCEGPRDSWPAWKRSWCCEQVSCPDVSSQAEGRRLQVNLNVSRLEKFAPTNVQDIEIEGYCQKGNPLFGKKWPLLTESVLSKVGAVCPPWTCMFTAPTSREGDEFLIELVLNGMATAIFLGNPCRFNWLSLFGFGRCAYWLQYYWVIYPPTFAIKMVVWTEQENFSALFQAAFSILTVLLSDAYMIVVTTLALSVIILAIWHRKKIAHTLGIEDTNIVHMSFDELWSGFRRQEGEFQICVWMVVAKAKLPKERYAKVSSPASTSSPSSWWGSSSTVAPEATQGNQKSKAQEKQEMKPMNGQGHPYNMYVRCGYGDNEPQHSRVVSGHRLMDDTTIVFKHIVRFNKQGPLNSGGPLFLTVKQQGVVGSTETARCVIPPNLLEAMLREADRLEIPNAEPLCNRQVQEMMKSNPNWDVMLGMDANDNKLANGPDLGFDLNFFEYGGGGIIFAVANVPET